MLRWSLVNNEEEQFTQLADRITVSSFAISKDKFRDRLITCLKLQNRFVPEPSNLTLPNPHDWSVLHVTMALKYTRGGGVEFSGGFGATLDWWGVKGGEARATPTIIHLSVTGGL